MQKEMFHHGEDGVLCLRSCQGMTNKNPRIVGSGWQWVVKPTSPKIGSHSPAGQSQGQLQGLAFLLLVDGFHNRGCSMADDSNILHPAGRAWPDDSNHNRWLIATPWDPRILQILLVAETKSWSMCRVFRCTPV